MRPEQCGPPRTYKATNGLMLTIREITDTESNEYWRGAKWVIEHNKSHADDVLVTLAWDPEEVAEMVSKRVLGY